MKKSAFRQLTSAGLAVTFALLQWACRPEAGEAYSSRKLEENKTDIESYLRTNNMTAQQTATNLYYVVTKANPNGQKPQLGDEMRFQYVKYRLDGIIVDSSASASPVRVIYNAYGGTLAPGLYEGVQLLKEGEEADLLMPFNLQNVNEGTLLFPAFSPARYKVKVLSVRDENEQIADYISANALPAPETTSSGLRFLKTTTYADSAQVQDKKSLTMKYTGRFLDNTIFDSNNAYSFIPGEGVAIKGFEEAVLKMRVREKATIIIPSAIAYGVQGRFNSATRRYDIPPYSPLLFEIEIVSATK